MVILGTYESERLPVTSTITLCVTLRVTSMYAHHFFSFFKNKNITLICALQP